MGKIVPVILSGGAGTRLWPVSRAEYPKQLQPLVSDRSMLEETVLRVSDSRFSPPLIVSNDTHRFVIAAHLQELGIKPFLHILEPTGRNTAPATAVAAMALDEDDVMLVMPADHHIEHQEAFLSALDTGYGLSQNEDCLVTFGVIPTKPETGYGYVRQASALGEGAYRVSAFVEKPDAETASHYLDSGNYHWNSGIFMFRAATILEEMERYCPEILHKAREALVEGTRDLDFMRLDTAAFHACPAGSLDYAVMEHTQKAVVVPVDMGWNDIGNWASLWEIGEKDKQGNVQMGDVVSIDCRNTYVRSQKGLVATLGLQDIIVVKTDDAVMVADRTQAQNVKALVSRLTDMGRSEHKNHRRVYRPWGYYESLIQGARHQVKSLVINAGGALSLQRHRHRAEHWVVVHGRAQVTIGDSTRVLEENQSCYIPVGTKHRLENPYDQPLSIIEVQTGHYLGEDDIERFDDIYGRVHKQDAAE